MDDIKNFTRAELETYLCTHGFPSYHARQLYAWLYARGDTRFEQMMDLSQDLRHQLAESYALRFGRIIKRRCSKDGTRKLLIRFSDGKNAESVLIPAARRMTGCVSTQIGCRFGCRGV